MERASAIPHIVSTTRSCACAQFTSWKTGTKLKKQACYHQTHKTFEKTDKIHRANVQVTWETITPKTDQCICIPNKACRALITTATQHVVFQLRPDEIGPMPGLSPLCLLRIFYALERTQTIINYTDYHQLCRLMLIYNFDIIRFNCPCTSIMLLL